MNPVTAFTSHPPSISTTSPPPAAAFIVRRSRNFPSRPHPPTPPTRRSRILSQATNPSSPPSSPDAIPSHDLKVDRKSIEAATRYGRSLRLRRYATLAEIGAPDEQNASDRVQIAAVVQRVRRNFRVMGKVRAPLYRRCDRCAREYVARSRGTFEVWLATDESGLLGDLDGVVEEEDVEAVEPFGKSVLELDLATHVRDAVYLGLPSKGLCRKDCRGVQGWDESVGTVTYCGDAASQEGSHEGRGEDAQEQQRTLADQLGARDKLIDLKRRLETLRSW